MATGTLAVQIAEAFQVRVSLRGAPGRIVSGTSAAVWQIGAGKTAVTAGLELAKTAGAASAAMPGLAANPSSAGRDGTARRDMRWFLSGVSWWRGGAQRWVSGEAGGPILPVHAAPEALQRRPVGEVQRVDARVGGDEAPGVLKAQGRANERAIDVDDVRLSHGEIVPEEEWSAQSVA
jgi:hypothetical protein